MKNNNLRAKKIEDGLQFIESFQRLMADKDDKTVPISVRIPKNVLDALKFKAKLQNKKYQSLMLEFIRNGLKQSK